MIIAIDAMGGDHAPDEIVKGAWEAAEQWNDVEIVLVGDTAVIERLLPSSSHRIRLHHADEVILNDDEPVRAVRRKKNASMVIAGKLVQEGKADAMISAGNTGALMATGLLVIGRIEGVERPGLAPIIPTLDGRGVLAIDLGANMDASPQHIVQYAIMGSIYRQKVHGIERPRVGLLNVGTEAMKGNELTKTAYPLLEQAPIEFVGNVESRDIMDGACDVIVCDGFAGNIMLKAMEGTAVSIMTMLKQEFQRSFLNKLAGTIMRPGLQRFKRIVDYREHGGAPLLGIRGVCIKSHGSSDSNAIKNAVRQTRMALKNNLVHAIETEISRK